MNKLVYLYELDSVRVSPWEIDRGRRALYEEIVMRGNRVVLTFQQVTVSKIFLELLKDTDNFEVFASLFENGALCLSGYRDPKTKEMVCSALQYIQNALDRKTDFIFSGKSIDNENLLMEEKVRNALKNYDLDVLKSVEDDVGELKNYIKLMFRISIQDHAINRVKDKSLLLSSLIENVCDIKMDNSIANLFYSATKWIQEIKAVSYDKDLESRSVWFNIMEQKNKDAEIKSMAEAIINLCYNYVVEDSISNVSKRYNDKDDDAFQKDFECRLLQFWEEYKAGKHYLVNGTVPLKDTIIHKLNWGVAKREWEMIKMDFPVGPTTLYSNRCGEKILWELKVLRGNCKKIFYALCYMVIFGILSKIGEGRINSAKQMVASFLLFNIRPIGDFLLIIIAGILSSILLKVFKVPDVLESMQSIIQIISDGCAKVRFSFIKRFCNDSVSRLL